MLIGRRRAGRVVLSALWLNCGIVNCNSKSRSPTSVHCSTDQLPPDIGTSNVSSNIIMQDYLNRIVTHCHCYVTMVMLVIGSCGQSPFVQTQTWKLMFPFGHKMTSNIICILPLYVYSLVPKDLSNLYEWTWGESDSLCEVLQHFYQIHLNFKKSVWRWLVNSIPILNLDILHF